MNPAIKQAVKDGLSLIDYAVLAALRDGSLLSRNQLTEMTGASLPAITRSTDRLRLRGLIAADRQLRRGGSPSRAALYYLRTSKKK